MVSTRTARTSGAAEGEISYPRFEDQGAAGSADCLKHPHVGRKDLAVNSRVHGVGAPRAGSRRRLNFGRFGQMLPVVGCGLMTRATQELGSKGFAARKAVLGEVDFS
jgi:hypothetical protein